MHNQANQERIPTPVRLADNLIGSLGGLTAADRAEMRRQVVMLINHSYALGYAAGSGVGLVARMRLRLARAYRSAGQDIKLALSAIRERMNMIFQNQEPRSRQLLAPAFAIQYRMRGAMMMKGDPAKFFKINRPAALLAPATDWSDRNQIGQSGAGASNKSRPKTSEGAPSQFRVTRDLGQAAALPRLKQASGGRRDQNTSEIDLSGFAAKKKPGNNPTFTNSGRQIINDRSGMFPKVQASRPY
jgi:hypothetical protein